MDIDFEIIIISAKREFELRSGDNYKTIMARKAEFSINGQSIMAKLKKVDRIKIYGWSTIEVCDESGSMVTLNSKGEGLRIF